MTNEEKKKERKLEPKEIKKRLKIIELFDIMFKRKIIKGVDKTETNFVPSSFTFYYFTHLNLQNSLIRQSKLISVVGKNIFFLFFFYFFTFFFIFFIFFFYIFLYIFFLNFFFYFFFLHLFF